MNSDQTTIHSWKKLWINWFHYEICWGSVDDIDDDTLLPLDLKDVSEPRRPSTSTYPQIDSNLKAQLKSNQILESGQTAGFIESDFLTSPRKMESFTTIGEHVTNLGQTNRGIPSPSQSKSI